MGEWQARARDFAKQTGLVRRYEWEQTAGNKVWALRKRAVEKPVDVMEAIKVEPPEKKSNIIDISRLSNEEQLQAVKNLTDPKQVLELGSLDMNLKGEWPKSVTNKVVLTGERRNHILGNHAEMENYEHLLPEIIHKYSDIHRDAYDKQMSILYMPKDEDYYFRIALWISEDPTRKNSIHSF